MYYGDTVRLVVNFVDFDGNMIDPTDIELKIYDSNQQLKETITIDNSYKQSTGVYQYDYPTPDDTQDDLIFEFRGMFNGKPILSRGRIKGEFV
jgi:hypothetical protein